MELYQAEWCPYSHKVRQRLTELGLDFTARQVPADRNERSAMVQACGTNEIPVLVTDDGEILKGEDEIMPWLGRFDERDDAEEHRRKARKEVPEFAA
jgi:glutathione S-transferase